MKDKLKIDRLERSVSRLQEEVHALKDENAALKNTLENKNRQLDYAEKENASLLEKMEQINTMGGEAIEAAYEAKMKYEKAEEECRNLMKKYSAEMRASLKQIKLIRKG